MCRNIRTLHNFEPPATAAEIHAAALQYVRKVSGMTKPSHDNEAAFARAIAEIATTTRKLLRAVKSKAPARNRDQEAVRARARWQQRAARMRAAVAE